MEKDSVISGYRMVIMGGSAGSLSALLQIIPFLNPISFALVIILHRKQGEDSTLEELIALKTSIPVIDVEDKVSLKPGNIYIAPSDYHLLFENDDVISLDISEKINYSRPSIDVSFESAAEVYGKSLVGILLSGANSDGTEGLKAIKNEGGIRIVQEPKTAEIPFMPQNAINFSEPDLVLTIPEVLNFMNRINSENQ